LAALTVLRDLIPTDGYVTQLVTPAAGRARLYVQNRQVARIVEAVYAGPGVDDEWWFWWGWAEPICRVSVPEMAARQIMNALRVFDTG
jgi:hypothetical protein